MLDFLVLMYIISTNKNNNDVEEDEYALARTVQRAGNGENLPAPQRRMDLRVAG